MLKYSKTQILKQNHAKDTILKTFIKNIKQIAKLFKKIKGKLLIALIFAIMATFFSVVGPKIQASAINELFYGLKDIVAGVGSINFYRLIILLLAAIFVFICSFTCQAIQSIICTNVSKKVCYDLRKDLIHKINLLPISYFESNSKGNLLSRVINDVDMLAQNISNVFISIATAVTMLVGSVVMMYIINSLLATIIIVLIPLSILFTTLVVKFSQQHFINQQNTLGEVNGYVVEHISGHSVVQLYNKQKQTVSEFSKINQHLFKESIKARIISQIASPLFGFVNNLSYIVVVILGAYFSIIGTFTVGDILAFTQYVNNFSGPLNTLISTVNIIQQMAAASQRIYEFLDLPNEDEINKEYVQLKQDHNSQDPIISFKNVQFSYDKEHIIINNFSLDIKKGQTVAIVGPTGAGKTTLVKLLMRFYDIDKGQILLYGHDVSNSKREDVRKHIAMVLQDIWLFWGSIKDNIRYGKDNASDLDVQKAAKTACADIFINNTKDKFNTEIYEGAKNFSLGQKQLISIARAIIAEREIMILDEATSSVDTATEEQLYKAFNKIIDEKTCIVIAHRLSTIKKADIILVLNNGDIVEQGKHEELLKKKGFYFDLYMSGKK